VNSKTEIRNELDFNYLISITQSVVNNYILDKLKIMIKGKESCNEWDLKEVFKEILGDKYNSTAMMPVLDFNQLPLLKTPFSRSMIKNFQKTSRDSNIWKRVEIC
jgi:hypothetical protein